MKALSALKITERRRNILTSLNLNCVEDVLRYYPSKYEANELIPFAHFKVGERVVFKAEIITAPSTYRYQRNRSMTRFKVYYDEEELSLTIFNRPWARELQINQELIIIGKYEGNNRVTVLNYYDVSKANDVLGIVAVYPLKEGITQNDIHKIIDSVLKQVEDEMVDVIPEYLLVKHQLVDFKTAILNIHHPSDIKSLKQAIVRIKYEEFLRFYLAMDILSNDQLNIYKAPKVFDESLINELISHLEFELTSDQQQVINEILTDLKRERLMYRLLQGDVGSGKTVVSLIALYANYLSHYQGVLMAPTEILAKQHYEYFKMMLEDKGVKVELIYSMAKDKNRIKQALVSGEIDILIGTHALFSDDVEFKNLGLIITDEQQRFGVEQRRKLKNKAENADFLLMSATPIPRTLASAIYGDMDISTIKTMPSNRKGCDTYVIQENSIQSIKDDLLKILNEGRQMYVIASAIEANEQFKAKDAENLALALQGLFKDYQVGLLHGKMSSLEKAQIMQDFELNKIQVLVSTTVVEVGVNVKNATVMVVYNAERFGMSQLHQLRGRVQRSHFRGSFYLLSDSKDAIAKERFEALKRTNDGFEIAAEDLKLRGPGDILGTRQSGLANFVLGDILKDTKIIEAAKNDARTILEHLEESDNLAIYQVVSEIANQNYVD